MTKWQPIDINAPISWQRHRAWRFGNGAIVAVVAIAPTSLMFGLDIVTQGAWGAAIVVGPFMVGIGINKRAAA